MRDKEMEEMLTELREEYNPPPETPRDEMWSIIQARLGSEGSQVVSLETVRRSRVPPVRKTFGWAAAAAAVLVVGIGLGRFTAPVGSPATAPGPDRTATMAPSPDILRAAAVEHLVRTESLLTLVRADARAGRVEPSVGPWARGLLTQTRLLMDAEGGVDPVMSDLLEDLELVLIQIVGVANAPAGDEGRVESELNLALEGLREREVLTRIQAVVPAGPRFVGT